MDCGDQTWVAQPRRHRTIERYSVRLVWVFWIRQRTKPRRLLASAHCSVTCLSAVRLLDTHTPSGLSLCRKIPKAFRWWNRYAFAGDALVFLGTWEKRKLKLGTREQKHILGKREHQNRRNTFREHGNTRKILLETREHGPPWESLNSVLVSRRSRGVK